MRVRYQKMGTLLAFLAYYRDRAHDRDDLANLLWPEAESDNAKRSLRTALSELRHLFTAEGKRCEALRSDRKYVWLDSDAVITDVAVFEAALEAARRSVSNPVRLRYLKTAASLYTSPLLTSSDEPWVIAQRYDLEEQYVQAVTEIVRLSSEAGDHLEAARIGRGALVRHPLREELLTEVVRALSKAGERSEAILLFEQFEIRLFDEMGLRPSNEALKALEEPAQAPHTRTPVSSYATAQVFVAEPKGDVARVRPVNSLPALIGREREAADILTWLESAHGPSITTLTGLGGVGKSRLALEVADVWAERSGQPVYWASFEDASLHQDVWEYLWERVRPANKKEGMAKADVLATLAEEPCCLILDACELSEGSGQAVWEITGTCSNCRILATSRRPLGIEGEEVYPVVTLELPEPGKKTDVAAESASVRLFVQACKATVHDFHVTSGNAASVFELCRRLDGLPLALRLAAARIGAMPPSAILAKIDEKGHFLTKKGPQLSNRHASLEATLEWSFAQLSEPARHAVLVWSAFAGGFDGLAAARVLGQDEAWELLEEAVDANLVSLGGRNGERYSMLETVRLFAMALARERGSWKASCEVHARYFAEYAEKVKTYPPNEPWSELRDSLGEDMPNLLAAASRGFSGEVPLDFSLRVFAGLRPMFERRSHHLSWSGVATKVSGLADSVSVELAAECYRAKAILALNDVDSPAMREASKRLLEMGVANNIDEWRVSALNGLALADRIDGEFESAERMFLDALNAAERSRSETLYARIQFNLGCLYDAQGRMEDAEDRYEQVVRAIGERGEKRLLAAAFDSLARLACEKRDYSLARRLFSNALVLQEHLLDFYGAALTRANMAGLAMAEGDPGQAVSHLQAAIIVNDEARDLREKRSNLAALAYAQATLGEFEDARASIEECRRLQFAVSVPLRGAEEENLAKAEAAIAAATEQVSRGYVG